SHKQRRPVSIAVASVEARAGHLLDRVVAVHQRGFDTPVLPQMAPKGTTVGCALARAEAPTGKVRVAGTGQPSVHGEIPRAFLRDCGAKGTGQDKSRNG
ncbi:MAG: hypothetical protein ACK56I_19430, partial [bacterium]